MSSFNSFSSLRQPDDHAALRSLFAAVLIAGGLVVLFMVSPSRDPSKVVAGIPCSVLSENEIGSVLGEPMRLMPTDGTVCEYVSNGARAAGTLFVVAKREASPPAGWSGDAAPVANLGDAALQHRDSLYVRFGARAYVFTRAASADRTHRLSEERLLAGMVRRAVVARNR